MNIREGTWLEQRKTTTNAGLDNQPPECQGGFGHQKMKYMSKEL